MTELETKLLELVKSIHSDQENLIQRLNDTADEIKSLNETIETLVQEQNTLGNSLGGYATQLQNVSNELHRLSASSGE